MQVIHDLPGRVRFSLDSEHASCVLDSVEQDFLTYGQDLELQYNPRTQRALAVFSSENGNRARLEKSVRAAVERASAIDHFVPADEEPAVAEGKSSSDNRIARQRSKQPRVSAKKGGQSASRKGLMKAMKKGGGKGGLLPAIWSGFLQGDSKAALTKNLLGMLAGRVTRFFLMRPLIPIKLRPFRAMVKVLPVVWEGFRSLLARKLDVSVLDASALVAALLMRDFQTAHTVTFLLGLGETMEEWTREQSRESLTAMFTGAQEPVWVVRDDVEMQIAPSDLEQGDHVIIRSGARIPVDGVVVDGTALVNQSSMTGEPLPVKRSKGHTVHAGTVIEEGTVTVEASSVGDETRFAKIAQLIEESEDMKANIHGRAEKLADSIVPFSFAIFFTVLFFTRDWRKAASVLLADYSCAIKLSTPLVVRSAMLESARKGAIIKGGKYIEKLAELDAMVLDKTGTLTRAEPLVTEIKAFNGHDETYVLRNAACLEEHFPHPVAAAVVRKAEQEGLLHEERHAEVEYILAHGIVSSLNGDRVLVGSRHFVHEDEGIDTTEAEGTVEAWAAQGLGCLYMAVGDKLAGVIAIADPLREEAPGFIRRLENTGMKRIVMLTGDNGPSARTTAKVLGINEVVSSALPDTKTQVVDGLKLEGLTVAMVGDGINDSAGLARADVGISMRHGADIAQEACDMLLMDGQLTSILDAASLSKKAMQRIRRNYGFIVGSNTLIIGLGLTGFLQPALLAFLHNAGTVLTCAHSLRPLEKKLE